MEKLYIASVTDAANRIITCYRSNLFDDLNKVQEYMSNKNVAKSIAGNADQFHNASVALTRFGLFEYAYALVGVGHNRDQKNTDLLADLLCYGMHCKQLQELVQWYEELDKIHRRFWTWRAYQFSCDFWMAMLPYAESNTQRMEYEKTIISLIKSFKDNFKFLKDKSDCEKAYMMGYDFYYYRGEESKAIKELHDGVVKLPGKCAQCALKLADYYFSSGNYSEAAKYAQIAIDVKEDQSSINRGYTYYILAMSKENNHRASNSLRQSLKDVFIAYHNAYINLDSDKEHLLKSVKFQVRQLEYEFNSPSNIPFANMDNNSGSNLAFLPRILQGQIEDDN